MSAYMCDNITFQVLVLGGIEYGVIGEAEARDTGQMLADENAKSLRFRYNDDEHPVFEPAFADAVPAGKLHALALLKTISCYTYQACEHPSFEDSWAYAYVEKIKAKVLADRPEWAGTVNHPPYGDTPKYKALPGWDDVVGWGGRQGQGLAPYYES